MILRAVLFLVLGFTPGSECLVCYQCADTRMDGPCQSNTADLVQSNNIWSNKTEEVWDDSNAYLEYVKSCPPEQQYCVIERIEDKGVMFAYIRDCSDGVTMSVNDVERFQNITFNKNNFTTCGFRFQIGVVCITLCEGNFCNGPITESGSGYPAISFFLLMMTLCLMLCE